MWVSGVQLSFQRDFYGYRLLIQRIIRLSGSGIPRTTSYNDIIHLCVTTFPCLFAEMLKWTVSRSLSTASSTPHGPGGGNNTTTTGTTSVNHSNNKNTTANDRRPFRDLSNTPPAGSSSSRRSSSRMVSNNNVIVDGGRTPKRTPSRRRRCRSHGSDLRGYFQVRLLLPSKEDPLEK